MGSRSRTRPAALAALSLALVVATWLRSDGPAGTAGPGARERVLVPKDLLAVDDGDSLTIRWKEGIEVVRLLGIDSPETLHLEHDIPYAQPFGDAAAGFLSGCLASAAKVELLRAEKQDPFGRTLGYLFVDGANVSVLALQARMAVETVGRYGDNGCPEEAAACTAAAKAAGPVAFEDPHLYRKRMHAVSKWLKEKGLYPRGPEVGGK
jgi:endonuclease YncB( thermonuclease family)